MEKEFYHGNNLVSRRVDGTAGKMIATDELHDAIDIRSGWPLCTGTSECW